MYRKPLRIQQDGLGGCIEFLYADVFSDEDGNKEFSVSPSTYQDKLLLFNDSVGWCSFGLTLTGKRIAVLFSFITVVAGD